MASKEFESAPADASDEAAAMAADAPVVRVYGRPFRKGQSGNPSGKRKPRTGAPGDRLIGAGEPTREMILREAYRTITVREGDAEYALPANQAVFRALTQSAVKGNQHALRQWTAIVREAEAEQRRAQLTIFHALEREARQRADKMREWKDGDDYDPYASDIIVDSRDGKIVIRPEQEGDDEE